jgi:hypothetical protein
VFLLIPFAKTTTELEIQFKALGLPAKCYAMTFGGNLVPVCQKAFLGILQVKRCRVESAVKRFAGTGRPLVERIGGGHVSKKYEEGKDSDMKSIKKFKCTEVNFCISSTSVRMYLSSRKSPPWNKD